MAVLHVDYSNIMLEDIATSIGIKSSYVPMLVDSFVSESKESMKNLKEAMEINDFKQMSLCIHSIRGSAGNLKFNEIHDMAREMEIACKNLDKDFDYMAYYNAILEAILTIKSV
jgi:HPt (histidine-containing phosphotransfer) domain-containing protein